MISKTIGKVLIVVGLSCGVTGITSAQVPGMPIFNWVFCSVIELEGDWLDGSTVCREEGAGCGLWGVTGTCNQDRWAAVDENLNVILNENGLLVIVFMCNCY